MTMLPSARDAVWNRHVLIYLVAPDNANFAHISNDLRTIELHANPLILGLKDPEPGHVRFIVSTDSTVDLRIAESCDALLAVLDGATGVGPGTINAWNLARDLNTPRHFAVTGTVNGRVDFDELAAVATRTMEPELLVRYLPIDADDENSLAGIFDVLTSEIHEFNDSAVNIRPSDPEHILLTADRRDDLFDQLAHLGLDDQALQNHRAGLPISITKLETAWSHPDAISITPIENQVGTQIIKTWLTNLNPHWIPTLTTDENTIDVTDSDLRVGVAITETFARMWSQASSASLVAWNDASEQVVSAKYQDDSILIADNLVAGMTISNTANNCELITPVFD